MHMSTNATRFAATARSSSTTAFRFCNTRFRTLFRLYGSPTLEKVTIRKDNQNIDQDWSWSIFWLSCPRVDVGVDWRMSKILIIGLIIVTIWSKIVTTRVTVRRVTDWALSIIMNKYPYKYILYKNTQVRRRPSEWGGSAELSRRTSLLKRTFTRWHRTKLSKTGHFFDLLQILEQVIEGHKSSGPLHWAWWRQQMNGQDQMTIGRRSTTFCVHRHCLKCYLQEATESPAL